MKKCNMYEYRHALNAKESSKAILLAEHSKLPNSHVSKGVKGTQLKAYNVCKYRRA